MSLIDCPACDKQVSSAAVACPHCAHPLKGPANAVTERTSKSLKKARLLAVAMTLFGFFGMSASGEPGSTWHIAMMLTLMVGLIWNIVITFRRWWHHE